MSVTNLTSPAWWASIITAAVGLAEVLGLVHLAVGKTVPAAQVQEIGGSLALLFGVASMVYTEFTHKKLAAAVTASKAAAVTTSASSSQATSVASGATQQQTMS